MSISLISHLQSGHCIKKSRRSSHLFLVLYCVGGWVGVGSQGEGKEKWESLCTGKGLGVGRRDDRRRLLMETLNIQSVYHIGLAQQLSILEDREDSRG